MKEVTVTILTVTSMAKSKGRPAKPGGEGSVVRIASDLVRKAKYLAAQQGVPVSDYLSNLLRPAIDKEFRKAARDLMDGPRED
jgi:hypothetical protein